MKHLLTRADSTQALLKLSQANTVSKRLKGLLGHSALEPGQGIWISPCNSVHSFFMRFNIDVLYLDNSGQILTIRPNMAPWRMSLYWKAKSVIELAAGECQRLRITPGDRITCVS